MKAAGSEKKARPQKEEALNCPRCNSTNTKFCYYNNYSLSQPRYYCKTCRRYWTQGGSFRNIPVGGASRRNKKQSSSSSSSPAISASTKVLNTDLITSSPPNFSTPNPKFQQGQDLNLAYNPFGNLPALPIFGKDFNPNLPIMELFKNGDHMGLSSGGLASSSYMVAVSGSDPGFGSGFRVHGGDDRYKAGLGNFAIDDHGQNGYGNLQGDHAINSDPSSRMLFPFEELKPVSSNEQFDHHQDWNGMLAGGSW